MNVAELVKKKYSGRSETELLEVIEKLSAQIMRQNIYLFGSRKERYEADPEGMKLLFDEAEEILDTAALEEDQEQSADPDRKKKSRGKKKTSPRSPAASLENFRSSRDRKVVRHSSG